MTLSPPSHLSDRYERAYGLPPSFAVRAPGRVDLIGAHVDYNDGYVLPAAIQRDVWLAAGPADSGASRLVALDFDESAAFRLPQAGTPGDVVPMTLEGTPLPSWALYPAGVAWALRSAGLATPPLNAVLTSDVPIGAGLASSAAVEVAYALAWGHLDGWELPPMNLAQLCQRAENEFVGVACGLMDQFSSLFGRQGHGLFLDCRTLDWEPLPMPPDTTLVVADTKTRRELTGGMLNARRTECEGALRLLKERLPHIRALRDVSQGDLQRWQGDLPEPLRSRARHVVDECARVLQVAEAMRRGDASRLGALMNDSQASSRDLYETSGPELDAMWEAANAHPACLGGRFVGAGFAGCLIFLVETGGVQPFMAQTSARYLDRVGTRPDLYVAGAAQGAQVVPLT